MKSSRHHKTWLSCASPTCQLCFCSPATEERLGWKGFQQRGFQQRGFQLQAVIGAAAAAGLAELAPSSVLSPLCENRDRDRQQSTSQESSAQPWHSCVGESSTTPHRQCLGCFLLPQQRNKPTTWPKVQGFSP